VAKIFSVSLDVHEHVGGGTYTESRFSLKLRTERDLATLQDILIAAANEANREDFMDEPVGCEDYGVGRL